MTRNLGRWATTAGLMAALCACGGGGGGGGGLVSTPTPPPGPTPNPTPNPTPGGTPTAAAAPLTGIHQDTEFPTRGDAVQIRWDEQAKTYEVKLPTSEWAALVPATNGNFDVSLIDSVGSPITHAQVGPVSGYSYTGMLKLFSEAGYQTAGIAFGIPTAASEVPVTGTATYLGALDGYNGADAWISGDAKFDFDFAAGTLAGYIQPVANGGWTGGDLGRYDFANTVYSKGSQSFSGDLHNATNSLGGSFNGNFNGHGAVELMGKWTIQVDMCTISFCDPANPISPISGIVVGKKQ